jgi:GAF domain-containing protein/HAMP domain-containing protein
MLFSKNRTSKNPQEPESGDQDATSRFLQWIAWISAGLALIILIAAIFQGQWSLFALAGLFAIVAVTCVISLSDIWDTPLPIKLLTTLFTLEVALVFATAIFTYSEGFATAMIAVLAAFLFAAYNKRGWLNEYLIPLGIAGALIGLALQAVAPFPQIETLFVNIIISIIFMLVLAIFIRLLFMGLITLTLRMKLTMSALAIALVPLLVLASINSRNIQKSIQTQSNESLRIAAELTVDQLDSYFSSTLSSLETEASLPSIVAYLKLDTLSRPGSIEETNLSATLRSLQTKETTYTPDYGVINRLGINVFDTDASKVGVSELDADYFQQSASTNAPYVSTVEFVPNSREAYIHFIAPIYDADRTVLGYLRASVDARVLQAKMLAMSGLIGTHSYPILIDQNGLRLADTANPNHLYHFIQSVDSETYYSLYDSQLLPSYIQPADIISEIPEVAASVLGAGVKPFEFFTVNLQESLTGIQDTATYSSLESQKWYVVYLQEQSAVVAAQKSLARTTALLAILMSAIISVIATIASNIFTRPILDLTDSAVKVSAGDLTTETRVTSRDEIGVLGNAFNSMTAQLKESIDTLESRVRERTQQISFQNEALLYRSRQLQTVADVARGIVSTTDFESLLTNIATLISDRFNYYHVGIFLIDESGENAVLRASNSVGGQRMLERQHKLKVGQVGIVGYVTAAGQPRIATDVGKDAVFFNNPDLPETKSEMALPLRIEDRVIGALDIQSVVSNAFTEEDINLFATLADQVSIAINTNQLLANTEKALSEAQSLHRQYLDQEWTRRSTEEDLSNYKYTSQGLQQTEESLPEIRMVLDSNRPVTRSYAPEDKSSEPYSVLAVPILLRGQAIGVIHLRQNGEQEFVWSENELITVQNVADQVAQTLESARLFEQTIRRADRERRVLEITNKIRSSNEPQKMLEVTLEELKKHLGASQTQIVINVPGITSSLMSPGGSTGPVEPAQDSERQNT